MMILKLILTLETAINQIQKSECTVPCDTRKPVDSFWLSGDFLVHDDTNFIQYLRISLLGAAISMRISCRTQVISKTALFPNL